jgi:hypothetical protein
MIFTSVTCIFIYQHLSAEDLNEVNGQLISFSVLTCMKYQTRPLCKETKVSVPSSSTYIDKLLPWTWYDVSVATVNQQFSGPYCSPIRVQTQPEGLVYLSLFSTFNILSILFAFDAQNVNFFANSSLRLML